MTNLRAGLIGFGMMGRNHARILSNLDGVTLVAIADSNQSYHENSFGVDLVQSVEQVIDVGIDYCFVAVPTEFHAEIGMQLASASIHVLMEKPLAADYHSALRLAEEFEHKNLVGAVGHVERYNSAVQTAKQKIEEGLIGDILQIATRRQNPFPKRVRDVGVVRDLASHDIDLTLWLTGQNYSVINSHLISLPGRAYEDVASINARLSRGTIVSHLVNWITPFKERNISITGTKGTLICDTLTSDLFFYSGEVIENKWDELANFRGFAEGDVTRFSFPKIEPLRKEHEEFRNAVLGIDSQIVTMREGLEVISVSEEILAK